MPESQEAASRSLVEARQPKGWRRPEREDPRAPAQGYPRIRPACEISVLTLTPRVGEPVGAFFARLARELEHRPMTVLKLIVFGAIAAAEEGARALRNIPGGREWPVTWVEGAACSRHALAGLQAFVVADREVKRVLAGQRVVGSVCEDGLARHCFLAGIGPRDRSAPEAAQAEQTLENLEAALDSAGFALGDLARTWFFNDRLLAWYADFNRVRTTFYAKASFRLGSAPASTGVAGRNPAGAALTTAAWAVRPLSNEARVLAVASPLQCPAPAYGSSFSRAVEISSGDRRRLLISGTASIAPGGESQWVGDRRRQVARTLEVVAAILDSRGMGFQDVTRAVAYFKPPASTTAFADWLAARQLTAMPVVFVQCDLCRDDLLFEIELDATLKGTQPAPPGEAEALPHGTCGARSS